MIRLSLPTEPFWLELEPGARLLVRPPSSAIHDAARFRAERMVRETIDREREIRAAGGEVIGLPDLTDEDMRAGWAHFLYACALAQMAIVDWEGIGTAEGDDKAPITPDTIRTLISIPGTVSIFLTRYLAPLAQVAAEGNASGSAPNGSGAADPDIAQAAAPKARRARAAKRG